MLLRPLMVAGVCRPGPVSGTKVTDSELFRFCGTCSVREVPQSRSLSTRASGKPRREGKFASVPKPATSPTRHDLSIDCIESNVLANIELSTTLELAIVGTTLLTIPDRERTYCKRARTC